MDGPKNNNTTNKESIPPQTPPSSGRAIASRIIDQIIDSPKNIDTTNKKLTPPQTPPSPGRALASRIIDGIVSVFSPEKNEAKNVENQDATPALQTVYKACASGKLCNSPWAPIPCGHRCSSCKKHMHFWCFGNHSETIEFEKEYCIICCGGKASKRNADFQMPPDPGLRFDISSTDDISISNSNQSHIDPDLTSDLSQSREVQINCNSENDEIAINESTDEFHNSIIDDVSDSEETDEDDMNTEKYDETSLDTATSESNNDWVISETKYQHIKVGIDDSTHDMKHTLKKSVNHLKAALEEKKATMHYKSRDNISEESVNFAVFADEHFLGVILKLINLNEVDMSTRTTIDILELFVRSLLVCAFYGKSPHFLWSFKSHYPLFEKAIIAMGGINKFQHILRCLKSPKKHYGETWDNYFDRCSIMREMEQVVSKNCSSLINHKSMRNLTIDDDKLRHRSKLWKQLGYAQRKGIKSFGAVLNIACQAPLGMAVSMVMSEFNENVNDTIMILLQRYCNVERERLIDMNGGIINGDRGYEFDANINCHTFNTTKRRSTLPFTFGNCKSQSTNQQVISETGCQSVYHAKAKALQDKNTIVELLAYRSGTGKVVFTSSTKKEHSATRWTAVIKSSSHAKEFHSDTVKRCEWRQQLLEKADLRELTREQGSPEWFILRRFVVTSTVAEKVLRLLIKFNIDLLDNEQCTFLQSSLGISTKTGNKEVDQEYLRYKDESQSNLLKLKRQQLVDIAKEYGHPISGNKPELVTRILSGPKKYENIGSNLDEIVKGWFLKPLPKTHAFKQGSANEEYVLKSLKVIETFDNDIKIERDVETFGLVCGITDRWLSGSVDGVVDLNIDGTIHSVPVEIKTFSASGSIEDLAEITTSIGMYKRCAFGDNVFKACIKNIAYRVQVLHHALVFKAKHVLFVVAGKNALMHMLLVYFDDKDLDKHKSLLKLFVTKHLKWTLKGSHDPFPRDMLTEEGLSQSNYHVDVHSIKLHFALWKQLHQIIEEKNVPIPRCLQIVPNAIAYWNKNKVFVDVMSRLLSHIKIPFKKADPVLQLVVRFTFIMLINGYMTTQYTQLSPTIFDDETKSYVDIKKKYHNKLHYINILKLYVKILRSHPSIEQKKHPYTAGIYA